MVKSRRNLSNIKLNNTRKITRGGADVISAADIKQREIENSALRPKSGGPPTSNTSHKEVLEHVFKRDKKLFDTERSADATALGASSLAMGVVSTALPATTLLTAGVGEAALSVGSWLGGGALLGIGGGLAGPLVTIVTATMATAYATYSVVKKNQLKSKIRHFIKKQMLATLDEMADKSKGTGLSASKYPKLEHYETDKANVKQFFIEYGIFTRLADIFMSMQSSMLHFYPSERLMFPIHFTDDPKQGNKYINFRAKPYDNYPVGNNFVCMYDYLTSNEYLYFSCDQLNDETTTSFLRFKLDSEIWRGNTPGQIVNNIRQLLLESNLKDEVEPEDMRGGAYIEGLGETLANNLPSHKQQLQFMRLSQKKTDAVNAMKLGKELTETYQDERDDRAKKAKAKAATKKAAEAEAVAAVATTEDEKGSNGVVRFGKHEQGHELSPFQIASAEKKAVEAKTAASNAGYSEAASEAAAVAAGHAQANDRGTMAMALGMLAAKKAAEAEAVATTEDEKEQEHNGVVATAATNDNSKKPAMGESFNIEIPAFPFLEIPLVNGTPVPVPEPVVSKNTMTKVANHLQTHINNKLMNNQFHYLRINNTDNRKSKVSVKDTNLTEIENEFVTNVVSLLQLEPFVKIIADQLKEFKTSYLEDYTEEAEAEDALYTTKDKQEVLANVDGELPPPQQLGGGFFTPRMSASGNTIKGSKDKMFQSLRTKKFSTQDKHSFIEFLYYSTYSFYRVFSKVLQVRESEMNKFFNNYVGDLMDMFKKNFSVIVNNSSVYISIARALEITFERKLGVAFSSSSSSNNAIDYNSNSSLNETGAIEERLKKANLFSTDSFFNLKNKKIRDYIFKTYANIQSLEKAMDDSSLGNRQRNVAGQLDSRFTREILGKNPGQQELIESHLVRSSLNSIFQGKFGMFKNILEHIDDTIDEFDGVSTLEFQTKLQSKIPKLANIGREGITFSFGDGLLQMGENSEDLIEQQIKMKEQELSSLQNKRAEIEKIKA
jgi:hypothetical protein